MWGHKIKDEYKKDEYGKSSTFWESHETRQDHIWPYFNPTLTENNYYNLDKGNEALSMNIFEW